MEFKGVEEPYATEIDEFFNSPVFRKFLTEFTIGHNKLKFYGLPLSMRKHSELIKTILTKDPPYFLATHGTIYEKTMTLLWIEMNDVAPADSYLSQVLGAGNLNLEEYLQIGRLINYFDIQQSGFTNLYLQNLSTMLDMSTAEDKKVIEVRKAQLVEMINTIIEIYEGSITKVIVGSLFNSLLNKAPELIDELKVIPIYDQDNKYIGVTLKVNVHVPYGYQFVSEEKRMIRVKAPSISRLPVTPPWTVIVPGAFPANGPVRDALI